ncbi:FadR/GntR family transcriptional regulator [Vibrio casei]|uniref:FadR family transcriptional regulator n=1 Tax=Vibrio casei TaxID=673372 RepID=A0A368LGX6_9VIBR|nr:FadR/GntR family transcriptional regulator [Vibrio casei]RCS69977.1 FadR family transcriptional regulator [Vibrio casei]SJN31243.1 Transcriptional regulator, GntR family [Vibrio casei]
MSEEIFSFTPMTYRLNVYIAQQIASQIIGGQLPVGSKLPNELDLCKKFGVSRTALRESIKLLASKGLITSKPKVGTFVQPRKYWQFLDSQLLEWLKDSEDPQHFLQQFLGLRKSIEPAACAFSAQFASDKQREELTQHFNAMTKASKDKDADAWTKADLNFHSLIFQSTSNYFFTPFGNVLTTVYQCFFNHTSIRGHFCIQEHKAVYQAIMDKEPENARLASNILLKNNHELLSLNPA